MVERDLRGLLGVLRGSGTGGCRNHAWGTFNGLEKVNLEPLRRSNGDLSQSSFAEKNQIYGG